MREIPKEILDRCTFKSIRDDPIEKIHNIVPLEPCACGVELMDVRRVRIQQTKEPQPHWREYCSTCKLVSVLDANDWKPASVLNAEMRSKNSVYKQKS